MRTVDVIIIGAGISGCAAAALLVRKGYHVALISRDEGTAHHLPESWVYNLPSSITGLGIEDKILAAFKKQSRCVFCSSDHQQTVEFSIKDTTEIQKGDVVWVNRNLLDRVLLNVALEGKALFYPFSQIIDCDISPSEVTLQGKVQNENFKIKASYIIDATGKTAFLSNHLKLPMEEKKLDSRVTYFSHFEMQSEVPSEMRIIFMEGGYLFCIPVSDRRISIGCVIAEDLIEAHASVDEIFTSAMATSSYVSDLIAQSTRILPIIPAKNFQRICLEPAGLRYRLIGEAAAFLDPFFCPGMDFAFFSAEQAVETIEQNSAQGYKTAVKEWLENLKFSTYEKMEQSTWRDILRLFADPHLPFIVSLMLTQAFCQSRGTAPSFKEGIQVARKAYEMASY